MFSKVYLLTSKKSFRHDLSENGLQAALYVKDEYCDLF